MHENEWKCAKKVRKCTKKVQNKQKCAEILQDKTRVCRTNNNTSNNDQAIAST